MILSILHSVRKTTKLLKQYWDGAFVLLLAAGTRLVSLSDPFFITDQGRALLAGRDILQGTILLSGPQTSVSGISLGPLYYYWTSFWLWISDFQIWGPSLGVMLANILAVFLLWLWLRTYWGRVAGVAGGGMLAVSGLASMQASIALEPGPVPLFAILWLWGLTLLLCKEKKQRPIWWIGTWIIILGAVQLNASSAILAVTTGTTWFFLQNWSKQYSKVWKISLAVLSILILIKSLVKGTTTTEYWWNSWIAFSGTNQTLTALFWLGIMLAGVSIWLQRQRFSNKYLSQNQALTWILGCWGSWSILAFSLKTVSGDHALSLLFVWAAAVVGITLQGLTTGKSQYKILFLLIGLFFTQFLVTISWLQASAHPRVSSHQPVISEIIQATNGQPYAFLYRGHLDIYDAADDHLQYLLWLQESAPVTAARRYFDPHQPELCETWIAKNETTPTQMLTLYSPATRAEEYQETAELIFVNKTDAITLSPAPSFLCR